MQSCMGPPQIKAADKGMENFVRVHSYWQSSGYSEVNELRKTRRNCLWIEVYEADLPKAVSAVKF